jgi:transposase-like protein
VEEEKMAKAYTKEIKQRARNLRLRGWSIGEISLKLGILKSTVLGWVRNIYLSKEQKVRIKQKVSLL